MKKKFIIISSSIVVSLSLIIVFLTNYFNTVILVQNTCSSLKVVDISIKHDKGIIIDEMFEYSSTLFDYQYFFSHIPKGEHMIYVNSKIGKAKDEKKLSIKNDRTYIIIQFQEELINLDKIEPGDLDSIMSLRKKEKRFMISFTNRLMLQ